MNVIELERAAREDVPPETRLCKDCKHCRPDLISAIFAPFGRSKYEFAKCAALKLFDPDALVDGKPRRWWSKPRRWGSCYCSTARAFSNLCGPDGRFWEKRR